MFMPLEEAVLKIIADHLGLPRFSLSLEDHITHDLGADSLDRLELIMTVEELLSIKIPEASIASIERIADVVNLAREMLPNKVKVEL